MTTDDISRVLDKIKKLVALSTSPNEHEAAFAAEKVQELLAEHNLSMSDVKDVDDPTAGMTTDDELVSSSVPWRRSLASEVAHLYFCEYFYNHRYISTTTRSCGYIRKDIHTFVGAPHNIVVAKLMFTYLTDTVERLALAGSKNLKTGRSAYITSFKAAASVRLCSRIRDRIAALSERETRTATGTTLPALADLYEQTKAQLAAFIKNRVGTLRVLSTRITQSCVFGARDGDRAGQTIGLDSQVGSSGAAHMLEKPK